MRELKIQDRKLTCPHCDKLIYDFDGSIAKHCPHTIFIYCWGGDPDMFMYVRKDYAEKLINAIKQSEAYSDFLGDGGKAFELNEEQQFINSQSNAQDECFQTFARFGCFPEVLSKDDYLFIDDSYYSGIRIAIDADKDSTARLGGKNQSVK